MSDPLHQSRALSGPGLEEPFPLPMTGFVYWKIRDSLSNALFTRCFPPVALLTNPPRGSEEGHPAAGTAAGGRRWPGLAAAAPEGCSRRLRAARGSQPCSQAARAFWDGHSTARFGACSLRGPIGLVAVSFCCGVLRPPRPAKPAAARHPPPRTATAFSSHLPSPRARRGSPGWPRRQGTARPPRT